MFGAFLARSSTTGSTRLRTRFRAVYHLRQAFPHLVGLQFFTCSNSAPGGSSTSSWIAATARFSLISIVWPALGRRTRGPSTRPCIILVTLAGRRIRALASKYMLQKLIRPVPLDARSGEARFVVGLDATPSEFYPGLLRALLLVYRHATHTTYHHQLLEAKLLGPANMVLSMATGSLTIPTITRPSVPRNASKIANSKPVAAGAEPAASIRNCGCASRAMRFTLAVALCNWPRTISAITYWVFKEGRLPALWQEFQTLLALCPQNRLEHQPKEGVRQVYRWVHDLTYEDSEGRASSVSRHRL